MAKVQIGEEIFEYADELCWLDVARERQKAMEDDILLVRVDGKLQELHKPVRSCKLSFVTAREKPGMSAYQRSATLMMLRAFYEVVGQERVKKVTVDFSVGTGLFVEPEGDFLLTDDLLLAVKARMHEYVEQRIEIQKKNVHTDEAVERFERHRMYDKARLFRYRRVSRVNLYSMGGFEDYYYGYMVHDAGYLRYFELMRYHDGFVLLLPQMSNPKKIPQFVPQEKLFGTLSESSQWGRRLDLETVGALNDHMASGRMERVILVQEALQEKRIGEIAAQIANRENVKFVMIAGPSSSGKTTFAQRLSIQLEALGLHPHPISVDNYFVNRINSPRDAQGNYNYEALECLDLKQFNDDMTTLLAGERVELPVYNFKKGVREYKGDFLQLGANDLLVIEGIHCLNEAMSYALPKESKFKVYISALTQLNIDEHNRIPTTDGRLIRRMVRDARTRGNGARETIRMWESVRRGEEQNIFPFQEEADAMFNSALIYELAVLKQYAEPLLFGIPRDCEEYLEAKRLLKFLDYFLGMDAQSVPNNSILREFIGGSCFEV